MTEDVLPHALPVWLLECGVWQQYSSSSSDTMPDD
jgi:hypothetical protein